MGQVYRTEGVCRQSYRIRSARCTNSFGRELQCIINGAGFTDFIIEFTGIRNTICLLRSLLTCTCIPKEFYFLFLKLLFSESWLKSNYVHCTDAQEILSGIHAEIIILYSKMISKLENLHFFISG